MLPGGIQRAPQALIRIFLCKRCLQMESPPWNYPCLSIRYDYVSDSKSAHHSLSLMPISVV